MNWVLLGFHEYTSIQFCLWVSFSLLRFFFKFPWFLFVFFLRFQLIFFLTNSALTRSFLLYFFFVFVFSFMFSNSIGLCWTGALRLRCFIFIFFSFSNFFFIGWASDEWADEGHSFARRASTGSRRDKRSPNSSWCRNDWKLMARLTPSGRAQLFFFLSLSLSFSTPLALGDSFPKKK